MKQNEINKSNRKTKPVLCLDIKTKKITAFNSTAEASETLSIPKTNIAECLTGTHVSTRGYKFVYGEDKKTAVFPNNPAPHSNEKTPVIVFNPDTSVYGFYESASSAAKAIGSTVSAISGCLANKRNTAKGYVAVAGTKEDYETGKVTYVVPKKHGKLFPIVKISFGGREVARYNSALDVDKESSKNISALVLRCATHKVDSAYGYLWMFLDEWVLSQKKGA